MDTKCDTIDPDSVFLKKRETTCSEPSTSIESLLYPSLPDGYFDGSEGWSLDDGKSVFESIVERYENAKVKPYVGAVDFNNDNDSPNENRPVMGYVLGLKFSF